MRQLLCHDDGVPIVHREHLVHTGEIHDGRNELVRDALDAMLADAVTCRQSRGAGRLHRMDFHGRVIPLEELAGAHNGAAGSDAGHECIRQHGTES